MKAIRLTADLTLLPLDADYCDHWAANLGLCGFLSDRPLLNSTVVHQMMNSIARQPRFAVVETNYWGRGSQAAAVYQGSQEIMSPRETPPDSSGPESIGPINQALRLLGVVASDGHDEFDTVGLGAYRDFGRLFEKYWKRKLPGTEL